MHRTLSFAHACRAAALCLLLVSLSACTPPEGPLTVGTNVWPGYEPAYIASERKLYGTADVQLRQFRSATEVLRAFRNGQIDVAALTLDEALLLRQTGIDIRIVMVADISAGADAVVVRPGIANLAGLAGQRIAVENSALGGYVLARTLELAGLRADQVAQRSMTVDEMTVAYEQGTIDAAVTFEPFRTRLLNLGAHELLNSKELPGEIIDVLVTRTSITTTHPQALQALVSGWLQAVALMQADNASVVAQVARRLKLTPEQVRDSYSGLYLPGLAEHHDLLAPDGAVAQACKRLIPVLEQRNRLPFAFDAAAIVTRDHLPPAG